MKTPEFNKMLDKYTQLRTERLALDKKSASIKTEEDMLRELIRKEMLGRVDQSVEYIHGKIKAELKMRAVATVTSWEELQKHIIETGEFDLLHKSVTVTAVRQRWEAGKQVPGIKQDQEFEVTISKVKE